MEEKHTAAFAGEGIRLRRARPYDEKLGHGFIHGQRMSMDVFARIPPYASLVVAEAAEPSATDSDVFFPRMLHLILPSVHAER